MPTAPIASLLTGVAPFTVTRLAAVAGYRALTYKTVRNFDALRAQQATTPMQFFIVLHFGQVRMDSSLSQGEDNLIGPQVNFVFRMEKVCGGLKQFCLLSEPAATELQAFFELTNQGAHALGGFTGEHNMYSC